MNLRPVAFACAIVVATALHALAFIQIGERDDKGEAPVGDEGILVSLGAPSLIGSGGVDADDQQPLKQAEIADVEDVPDEQSAPQPSPPSFAPERSTKDQAEIAALSTEEPDVPASQSKPEDVHTPTANPGETLDASQPSVSEDPDIGIQAPDLRPALPEDARRRVEAVARLERERARRDQQARERERQQQQVRQQQAAIDPEPQQPARRSSGADTSGNSNTAPAARTNSGGNAAERASYLSRVRARLARARRYPNAARQAGQEGVVQVRITINRQGRVTGFRITRSSGHAVLDQEVKNMISRVQPLPQMPASMTQPSITINMPVRFKLG